jgi:LPXTG-site transpeptidase (sortase) family protein
MGSPNGLADLFSETRRRGEGFLRRSLRGALPLAGAVVVLCGLLIGLFLSRGGGGTATSDAVLANDLTAQATETATVDTTSVAAAAATPTVSPVEAASAPSTAPSGSTAPGSDSTGPAAESGMRMKIPSIGVDAPVTTRVIGLDGVMGTPNGRFDAVWYDFANFPGMGGYPGGGGNAVFSGHVDYHPNFEAVFWDLHLLGPGDIVEVDLPDGTAIAYSVQWSRQIGPEDDFSTYATKTGQETITIITCQGTFNSTTHQYDHRLVVRGVRVS